MLRIDREEETDSDNSSFYSIDTETSDTSSKLIKFDSFKSLDSVHFKSDQSYQPGEVIESGAPKNFTPKNTTNVVIMYNSGATPKSSFKESEKKKKGIRFSFKRKKSSKKTAANEEGVGTDSDYSSNPVSPGVTPQITSQKTSKKNVSAPWTEEKAPLDINTGKYSQVSGKVLSERKFGPLVLSMRERKRNFSFIKDKQKENIPTVKDKEKLAYEFELSRNEEDRKVAIPEPLLKNVAESDCIDRILVREQDTVSEPNKEFQVVGKEGLIDSKYIPSYRTLHNEKSALMSVGVKGLDIAEGRMKQKESNKAKESSDVAKIKPESKLLEEELVNEAEMNTVEVETQYKTTAFEDGHKTSPVDLAERKIKQKESYKSKESSDVAKIKPESKLLEEALVNEAEMNTVEVETQYKTSAFEDEGHMSPVKITLDNVVENIKYLFQEITEPEINGSINSSEPLSNDNKLSTEMVTPKKFSLTDISTALSSPELDSIEPILSSSENTRDNFSFASPIKDSKYSFSSRASSTPDKRESETSTLNRYEKIFEDSIFKNEVRRPGEHTARFPRPLTGKHYAPFGRAYRSKNCTSKSHSQSFSNDMEDVFPIAFKSPSSISNQYISGRGDSYGARVSNFESSGQLSDSWAVSSSDKKEHLYKILVIGELGTGKTSIIKRYVHQFFCQHYRATIGVDFALKVLNWDEDTIIRLQLWDIAGQERFGNMTRVYYKQAVGAFIVFDVSNPKTFDAVTKWKNDLDSKVTLPDGSNIPTILLANKCDQPKEGLVTSPSKMDDFCRESNFAGWFETSAKEDINIDEATKFLISKIRNNEEEGLMMEEVSDKDKFSIDEPGEVVESKKCLC